MTTAQRQKLLLVKQVLIDASVAGGRVFTQRTRAINEESPNAVVVRLATSQCQLSSVQGGPTDWATLVLIESYGRMIGGEPDEASDQIVEAVFSALDFDPTLGGQVEEIAPLDVSWDEDQLDTSLACITAKFVITHRTEGRKLT
jgi:hypothetical protein